ncbi:MAG: hypothetical protein R3C03_05360 [Pirellulaceae bacterium]
MDFFAFECLFANHCIHYQGQEFDDPKDHPFGMQSKPEAESSIYPTKQQLIADFEAGHRLVSELFSQADNSVFENPVALPRWKDRMPTAAIALPYLMLLHENQHLGQVSAWRRAMGLPSV